MERNSIINRIIDLCRRYKPETEKGTVEHARLSTILYSNAPKFDNKRGRKLLYPIDRLREILREVETICKRIDNKSKFAEIIPQVEILNYKEPTIFEIVSNNVDIKQAEINNTENIIPERATSLNEFKDDEITFAFEEEDLPKTNIQHNLDQEIPQNDNFGFTLHFSDDRRAFTTNNYHNTQNLSLISWLAAIRYWLIRCQEETEILPSVRIELDDSGTPQYHNFTSAQINEIIDCITFGDLNNFLIRNVIDVGLECGGSDFEIQGNGEVVNSEVFILTIMKKDIVGGIKNLTLNEEKRSKKEIHGRYICRSPRSTGNNCLIEAFKFCCSRTDVKAANIRKELKFSKDGLLALSDIPKLEEYFKIKVSVVSGDAEDKLPNYLYPEEFVNNRKLVSEHELFYEKNEQCPNGHFSVVCQKLEVELDEEKNKKKQASIKRARDTSTDKYVKVSVIQNGKKMFKVKKENGQDVLKPKRFIFLDYETVSKKSNGYLIPYSCVIQMYGEDEKQIGRTEFIVGPNTGNKVVEWFIRNNNKEYNNIICAYNGAKFDNYILLESLAKNHMLYKSGIFIANGAILKMKFLSYTVMDLCKFTCCPLKRALKGFKCSIAKGDFDHNEVQIAYNQGKLNDWLKENAHKLKVYNVKDVAGLAELYFKVRQAIKVIGERVNNKIYLIEDYMTISQICFAIWKDTNTLWKAPQKREFAKIIKRSFIGGRSQIFRKEVFECQTLEDCIQSLDVKSLYPFVMEACDYPVGAEEVAYEEKKDKLGIYFCKVSNQPKTKITPLRYSKNKNKINALKNELSSATKEKKEQIENEIKKLNTSKPLNWNYNKTMYCVLCSVDIQTHREFKSEIEIITAEEYMKETAEEVEIDLKAVGFYWEEKSKKVFGDYIKPLREGKTEQDIFSKTNKDLYNPALREMYKMMMNSLSGKVGQKEYNTNTVFTNDYNDQKSFIKAHSNVSATPVMNTPCVILKGEKNNFSYRQKSAKPWHLSVFIYAYSRRHMYLSVLSKLDGKFATDTDSCHATRKEIATLIDAGNNDNLEDRFGKFHMGNQFGDFEGEIKFKTHKVYYVAPKCYGLFTKDNENKIEEESQKIKEKIKNESSEEEKTKLEDYLEIIPDNFRKMRFKGISPRDRMIYINTEFMEFVNKNIIEGNVILENTTLTKEEIMNKFKNCITEYEKIKIKDEFKSIKYATKVFSFLTNEVKLNYYITLKPALCEELYGRIMNNEIINVMSSRIEKKIGGYSCSNLRSVFMIKSASKDGITF